MSRRNLLPAVACYLAIILLAVGFSVLRVKTQNRFAVQSAPDSLPENPVYLEPPDPNAKPFFSLMTNRTYSTRDRTRVWVNYRGVSDLDFRVYRVKDPMKFFKQLRNPHQVGEDDHAEMAERRKRSPTVLEKLREFKNSIYLPIRNYVRAQLQNNSRKQFNQKFRDPEKEDTGNRTPLNVADYARVPLLNPDQMVSSWREKLPPLEDTYDRRMISLGKREPGVYLVEAINGDLRAFGVAIVTDLTMVQKTSRDGQMLIHTVDRQSGAPQTGARIEVVKGRETLTTGTTDKQGILQIKSVKKKSTRVTNEEEETPDGEDEGDGEEPASNGHLVMATAGENFAISDLNSFYFGGGESDGEDEAGGDNSKSYLYTDRPVYRPAQKVYFKGIIRRVTEAGYKLPAGNTVGVTIEDANSGRILDRELPLSSRGTFSGEVDISDEAPLGSYNITARAGSATANAYFEVQEYKKPEYKVTVATGQKFVNVGERAKFTVSARYFFGAPVTKADVKYYIYRARYFPPWRSRSDDDADFGLGDESEEESEDYGGYYGGDGMVQEGEGRLNADGRLDVEFAVPAPGEKDTWDYTYRLEAQVTDAARRVMEASNSFVGVRGGTVARAYPEKYVYYKGDTAKILVTTTDHEGRPKGARVKLSFAEWRWEKVTRRTESGDEYPGYESKERELSSASVETNSQGEASLDYVVPVNGSIHIKTIVEENGRQIASQGGYLWVADRDNGWSDYSYQEEGAVKLVPDKKSYRAGETAHVLALLPTDDAHLLVTTELMSVMSVPLIDSPARAVMIDVPIEARHAPNIFLNVTYVKNGELYTQDEMLVVPARDRLLKLDVIPNKSEYRPRDVVSYTVLARNADGSPAPGAEVSLGVVDESIYSIQAESAADIRREFYGRRYNEVQTDFSVNYYFTGYAGKKPINLAANRKPHTFADVKNDGEFVNPKIRKIFKDTAFWQPDVVTGADGKATVNVELPDNLTTWRATARAVTADTRVGTTVQKVVSRKDVILRLALPRFFTEGDTVTLSGVVHNYLKADKTTRISIEVNGARLLDSPTQTVTIPANGEHRVNWRVNAPQTGEMKILAKALTDTESDAIETALDVLPRGLKETRGETIALSDEEADKTAVYNFPANAEKFSRDLRIEVAPSIAGSLFGALDYLTSYPYGCTEQTMSSFLPTVVVAQTLRDVQSATIRDTNNINRKVRSGLRRLYNFQHDDGGWGWWKDDPTDAFMSAYVVDGLAMAKRAGYEIDEPRLERGRVKLKGLIDAGKTEEGKAIDAETRAYMIYALSESGGTDARYLNDLFAKRNDLQPYGRALLALALHGRNDAQRARTVAGEIETSARVGGAEAHWPSRYNIHGGSQSNDVEATALSLKALARITPQSEILPRAARWLVMSRRYGHYWRSTKETAFAIFGLTDYLKVSQELSPDYSVEVYLNGEQVLARQMTAADAASGQTIVIRRKGTEAGDRNEVRVVKRGPGMLYLSSSLVHYTSEEQVAARGNNQLKLTREYLRLRVVEGSDGTPAWKVEPLTGELRSGDTIVSRLHVEGEAGRYLLIEDPIPAGCEQIESVSGINLNYSADGWSDWYSAREFRDARTALFVNYFGGKATFQYAMRVQVPGQFRVAPARVEQMYQPTVQANAASGALTILDK